MVLVLNWATWTSYWSTHVRYHFAGWDIYSEVKFNPSFHCQPNCGVFQPANVNLKLSELLIDFALKVCFNVSYRWVTKIVYCTCHVFPKLVICRKLWHMRVYVCVPAYRLEKQICCWYIACIYLCHFPRHC